MRVNRPSAVQRGGALLAGVPAPVWWIVVGVGVLFSLVSVLGLVVVATMDQTLDTSPVRLERGEAVHLPDGRLFARKVAVYGVRPEGVRSVTVAELDCVVSSASGGKTSAFISGLTIGLEDRTVDGVRLSPLLTISRLGSGYSLVCGGRGVEDAAPVYVLPTSDGPPAPLRAVLLPVLAFGFLGGAALATVAATLAVRVRFGGVRA